LLAVWLAKRERRVRAIRVALAACAELGDGRTRLGRVRAAEPGRALTTVERAHFVLAARHALVPDQAVARFTGAGIALQNLM
jgi:hypothetical protein